MPCIRHDLKDQLKKCSKTMADLSRETGIQYRRLAGAIMGYWYLRPEEEKQINNTILAWNNDANG